MRRSHRARLFSPPARCQNAVVPSTHVSLHYHVIFSTKSRFPMIDAEWRPRLHEYLGGSVRGLGGVPLRVGGVADHVHLLIGLKAVHAPADIVREVKKASTSWVRESVDRKFGGLSGRGACHDPVRSLRARTPVRRRRGACPPNGHGSWTLHSIESGDCRRLTIIRRFTPLD